MGNLCILKGAFKAMCIVFAECAKCFTDSVVESERPCGTPVIPSVTTRGTAVLSLELWSWEDQLNKLQWSPTRDQCMNSMKLVSPLHSLYWSIHTKDESKIVKSIWSSLGLLFLCQIKTIAISKFSVTIFKLLLSFYGTQ